MTLAAMIYRSPGARSRRPAVLLVAVWLLLVLLACSNHVVWRDEVRALSIAVQSGSVADMLAGLHGEGHPSLWYFLLRGAHAVVGRDGVLQGVAVGVAAAAMLILALCSPFGLAFLALLLFGRPALFEYSVMARNYGISVLLMFLLPIAYGLPKCRGLVVGAILFLLANSNLHSVMLVGAFMVFWLIEVGWRDKARRADVVVAGGIAAVGVLFSLWTLYSPLGNAVIIDQSGGSALARSMLAMLLPGLSFDHLIGGPTKLVDTLHLSAGGTAFLLARYALLSVLLFGATLGLVVRPAAFVAALLALIGFAVFFQVIYPGSYRHEALWLAFLVTLYWIAGPTSVTSRAAWFGRLCLVVLIAIQIPLGLTDYANAAGGFLPESRGRDFAGFVRDHEDLRDAVIMADPDYILESLPYYMPNRLYFLRDRRYGRFVLYARAGLTRLTLGDILARARTVRTETGHPVIILLQAELDPSAPPKVIEDPLIGELAIAPDDVRAFLRETRLLQRFRPASSDESFDAYLLGEGAPAPP
jgi:hypothetical protein